MNEKVSVRVLCAKVKMSRQNFYKAKKERMRKRVDADLLEQLVRAERKIQPRLGGRKLQVILSHEIEEAGVSIGRDRFFNILRERDLLLEPLPKSPRTTNSQHNLPIFRNQIKDKKCQGPNEVWVSDLTYLRTYEGFMYLSLITDRYSRKILGFYVGETLGTEGCLYALDQALKQLPLGMYPIHHSDRGCQYCSHVYVKKLQDHGLGISMTEELHCYENALAERVNGILKQEYWLGGIFKSKKQVIEAVKEAVQLYNTRRPHVSLNYKTPEEVHKMVA